MDWTELQNWDEYLKLLVGLIAVTDPFGAMPMVLGLLEDHTASEKKKAILRAVITFAIALIIFTLAGVRILSIFGITVAALKIAGGVMFLFYALEMLGLIHLPAATGLSASVGPNAVGVVPIGIPLLAGPGSISTVIIFSELHASTTHQLLVIGVILTVALLVWLLFRLSIFLGHKLNTATVTILNRVMGLLLAAIAIEFILDGIAAHFPGIVMIH